LQTFIGLDYFRFTAELLHWEALRLPHALDYAPAHVLADEGSLTRVLLQVRAVLKNKVNDGRSFLLMCPAASEILTKLGVTVCWLRFARERPTVIFSQFSGLLQHFLHILSQVKVVADTRNAAVAENLVLKQVLSGKAIAELVRRWALVEDQLEDGSDQQAVVAASTHKIRAFAERFKLLHQHLVAEDRVLHFTVVLLACSRFKFLLRV